MGWDVIMGLFLIFFRGNDKVINLLLMFIGFCLMEW